MMPAQHALLPATSRACVPRCPQNFFAEDNDKTDGLADLFGSAVELTAMTSS
jgi:hypothetical protein